MKKLSSLLVFILFAACVFAQSPNSMSYQAVIRNSSNALVVNTKIGMQISILQTSSTGTPVYVETQTPTTNANGLASIEIGNGTVISGDFAAIDWSTGLYFIKTETDPTGAANYTVTGTSQLLSVPYALHATTADKVIGAPVATTAGDMQYWDGAKWVIIPVGTPGQVLKISDTNIPTWTGTSTISLITSAISSITATTAKSGGVIAADGGSIVSARGVCWSTSTNPTIFNDTTLNGSGSGLFTSELTGLSQGITYYVRAYAISGAGTSYGDEKTFIIPKVGDAYQGGILAYILKVGDPGYVAGEFHGLIAATNDLTDTIAWSSGALGATGSGNTAIGAGSANTTSIINAMANTGVFAAKSCRAYTDGTYTDWFLPSINELIILYTNRVAIGGFTDDTIGYWSSTGESDTKAKYYNFATHTLTSKHKLLKLRVRPMRNF